jgi:hypothetical protein
MGTWLKGRIPVKQTQGPELKPRTTRKWSGARKSNGEDDFDQSTLDACVEMAQ